MSDSKFCEINDYIFEAPNEPRKVKFQKLFSKVRGNKVLDIGCGYSGLYWALSYFERVDEIFLYEFNPTYLNKLNELIETISPEYLEESFELTITFLKEIGLISTDKSYFEIAEELIVKIKSVKKHSFFDPLPVSFDIVISNEAIECVNSKKEFDQVVRNIHVSLNQKGKLIGCVLNYANKTDVTDELITANLEGSLNPDEKDIEETLKANNFISPEIEVVEFPELGNRSKYIYYIATK